ncbi:MAG TPA: histidine--tRNA ligase [Candidatus Methanoperedens sp.]|nr:histidine--tRNA ligase [Candidatus Methanoperedens sp.]
MGGTAEIKYGSVRGTRDVLPEETARWRRIERSFREVFERYGYGEIRVPIFEETALFARGLGDASDIVEKEMYTFPDKSGNSLTLRPEGTAGVVRAFLENGLDKLPPPVKLWYAGPMFRYERPQKGRQRQFHQIGAELFGVAGPEADAELLEMVHAAFAQLGLPGLALQINSLGDANCRPAWRAALIAYFRPRAAELCENCRRRLEANPLRVLDCKAEGCRALRAGAPDVRDFLCEPCREHFAAVRALLDAAAVPYTVNSAMVRGLDYYTRTTFELTSLGLGAQDTVAAGGRYDRLVEEFGGKPTPGLGFALGVERLALVLGAGAGEVTPRPIFVAALGSAARRAAWPWLVELRRRGAAAEWDYEGRSLKSQMGRADRLRARLVVIVGENELAAGAVPVRDMVAKTQREVPLADLVETLAPTAYAEGG